MIPQVADVQTRFLTYVDDPNKGTFTDAIFTQAFTEAYDALFNAFLLHQCPRIQIITNFTVNPGTLSFTPASNNILDLADFDLLEERTLGSSELYRDMIQEDRLPQRAQTDRLIDFVWRFDTFYFVGATTARDVRLTYESSGTAPTSGSINVDGCLTFLARAAVGAVADVKGYEEMAARNRLIAYGPRYDQGMIGGELWRLISPRVREMQHVQIAPKPYSLARRITTRRVPYIAAQQPQGVGTAPAQFTSAGAVPTITGTMDGANLGFFLSYPVSTLVLYRNGVLQTQGVDYTFGANAIVFVSGSQPQSGDVLTGEGWI